MPVEEPGLRPDVPQYGPLPVSWVALHAQFGAGCQLVRKIKPSLTDALRLTLAVYPEARVDVEPGGFLLHGVG